MLIAEYIFLYMQLDQLHINKLNETEIKLSSTFLISPVYHAYHELNNILKLKNRG